MKDRTQSVGVREVERERVRKRVKDRTQRLGVNEVERER